MCEYSEAEREKFRGSWRPIGSACLGCKDDAEDFCGHNVYSDLASTYGPDDFLLNKDLSGYDAWLEEIKRVAINEFQFTPEAAETFDKGVYMDFFLDGLTPTEALEEDFSNA